VFGSFSETEAQFFQSPPPPEKKLQAKEATSVSSFQFGDLTGFGDLRVSDTPASENGAAKEALGRTSSLEEAAEKAPSPEASFVMVSPEKEVRRDEQASPKPAPKSWASLVGVQPGLGNAMRSSGHVKPSPPPVTKPVSNGSVRLQPRGLVNTGNSCFANATLQSLLSCPPFLNLLASIKSRNIPQTGYPALTAFANFALQFKAEPEPKDPKPLNVGRPFAPTMFDDVLRSFSPDQPPRGRPRQEDAQEFLSHLMDQLQEELLRIEGRSVAGQNVVEEDDEWETVGPKNRSALTRTHMSIKSPLSDIFGGQLYSVVRAKGNKASATVQPFLVLHLDILPEAVQSLEDALKFFAAPESLEGYKAASSKASEVVSARKELKIQTLPPVLIIHLMRFSYGAHGSGKVNKVVKYSNTLTIGRELLATTTGVANEGRKYELVATVTHHGKDPSAGHYTADCRQPDGRWLRFDDANVSEAPINRVLQEQAYLLFYKRVAQN
jgi:ubiquitin carboxyl-terminal hydrolase 10